MTKFEEDFEYICVCKDLNKLKEFLQRLLIINGKDDVGPLLTYEEEEKLKSIYGYDYDLTLEKAIKELKDVED